MTPALVIFQQRGRNHISAGISTRAVADTYVQTAIRCSPVQQAFDNLMPITSCHTRKAGQPNGAILPCGADPATWRRVARRRDFPQVPRHVIVLRRFSLPACIAKSKRFFNNWQCVCQLPTVPAYEATKKAKNMKQFIAHLLLGVWMGIIPPLVPAQQNQTPQQLAQEIEILKGKISELEKKLKIVENVEKMELQAKLAEANAKLTNVQFDRFKLDLRVDNDDRMRTWSYWFFSILAIIAVISGGAIWILLKSLIANSIERNLNGFKKAVDQVDILKNQSEVTLKNLGILKSQFENALKELGTQKTQQRVLEKEHAIFTLEGAFQHRSGSSNPYFLFNHLIPLRTDNELHDEVLLDISGDSKYSHTVRHWAEMVLANRKSPQLVSPLLARLTSVVDSDSDVDSYDLPFLHLHIKYLGQIPTLEAYHGLERFLNRLLGDNSKHRDLFLTWTAFALAEVSIALNKGKSVSTMRRVIPYLKIQPQEHRNYAVFAEYFNLFNLARYFEKFNEPKGIEDLLNHYGTSLAPDVLNKCLTLLQKHNPEFVRNWRVRETTGDTES